MDLIFDNLTERVVIIILAAALYLQYKQILEWRGKYTSLIDELVEVMGQASEWQDTYASLIDELVAVMEQIPIKLDSTWRQAVAELKKLLRAQ